MRSGETESQEEEARLERTLQEIDRQTAAVRETLDKQRSGVVSTRADMWENLPRLIRSWDDIVELTQNQEILNQQERHYLFNAKLLPRLVRMRRSPYFGRIDFRTRRPLSEENAQSGEADANQVYIGIAALTHAETGEHLVYDWRAPIASLFYDFEPGPASYAVPDGRIEGEMTRKRQYKVTNGKLEYMFDTDLKIDDDLLQEILGKSADNKMKTIVQSIQREQNRAIRDEDHRALIVLGPAGSGKTSIALHRVAYFLYRYRGELGPDQVVVLSPNDIFSDYISDVLPELGEENVVQKTFWDFVKLDMHSESLPEQMEQILAGPGDGNALRKESIAFKGSVAFYYILEQYIRRLESGAGAPFTDIVFRNKVVVTRENLIELFRNQYNYLPYGKRLDKAARRVLFLLEPHEEARLREIKEALARKGDPDRRGNLSKELKRLSKRMLRDETAPIKEKVESWTRVGWSELYRALFADVDLLRELAGDHPLPPSIDRIAAATVRMIDHGRLGYEDTAAALYLKAALGGLEPMNEIRHVVVDEAQDYSPVHFTVLRRLFPNASFTILGDLNQAIHPYLHLPGVKALEEVFADMPTATLRLRTSYRSTREIVAFTQEILGGGEPIQAIDRGGKKPLLISLSGVRAEDAIARTANSLKDEGHVSIAIICKTAQAAAQLFSSLSGECEAALVTRDDQKFTRGTVVIPSYLAKGLEFDAVIIHDAGAGTYGAEGERKTLYTACTRALHRLVIFYRPELSPFIAGISPALYETARSESIH